MKLNINLFVFAFLVLIVAFQLRHFQTGQFEQIYVDYYDKLDSLAWLLFSLMAYRLSRALEEKEKPGKGYLRARKCRLCCAMFTRLSICPFVNDWLGFSSVVFIGNYIWGISIFVIYAVKIYRNDRFKK